MQISVTWKLFACFMAGSMLLVGCEQSQGPGPWTFSDSGGGSDAEVDASDTRPDLPEDTWRGWYKATESTVPSGFYPEGNLQKNPAESGASFGCRPTIEPSQPAWGVSPTPAPESFRRYRIPAEDGSGAEQTLSSERLGFVEITGELNDPSEGTGSRVVAITDATTTTDACDTLDRLGRCGVPESGDICSDGFELYSEMSEPEINVRKAGVQSGWGPLEFDIRVDFDTNVADGGTSFRIQTSNNPFGPADGRLHDFQLNENTVVSLERICGSFGGNIVVSYPPENVEGWFRTIPARERNSDKNLVVYNLTASDGSVEDSAGNSDPESICPTDAFELWFAAEYESTMP